jgi:MFS family permease
MKESPMFSKLKAEGKRSVNPLKESFSHKGNFKMVLLALFGAVMGQGVIWYTGQFYAQNFLETKCNIEFGQSRTIMLWAIAFATPFFLFFGWLSDKIGRKWIMMVGMLLGVILYRPIFSTFLKDTKIVEFNEPEMKLETKVLITDKKDTLATTIGRNYSDVKMKLTFDASRTDTAYYNSKPDNIKEGTFQFFNKKLSTALYWKFIGLVFMMILLVTMVYGPIAAFLVEMFPTKIRYTSMSLPYHIGNGVFGGLVPFIGLLLTTTFTKDPLVGLWYPIGVAALCFVIGTIYLTNKIDKDVTD